MQRRLSQSPPPLSLSASQPVPKLQHAKTAGEALSGSRRARVNQTKAVETIVSQAETLLRFKSQWDEAIASGDRIKTQAFTDKAAKLLLVCTSLLKRSMRQYKKLSLSEAAIVVQAAWRSAKAQREYKMHLRRAKVVREIVSTERSYMHGLGTALSLFRKRLADSKTASEEQCVVLFNNLGELRRLNVQLWNELEDIEGNWHVDSCVGGIFLSNLKNVLKEYITYVRGYEQAIQLHEQLLKERSYRACLDDAQSDQMAGGLRLEAFLILPVQRFPRYQLLLRELLASTPATHPDSSEVMVTLEKVKAMTSLMNEETRKSATYHKLVELEALVEGDLCLTDRPTRKILAEVKVREVLLGKPSLRTIFCFDDMLMCVKRGKSGRWYLQWLVPGARLLLDAVSESAFVLVEYQRTEEYPYTETVEHLINTLDDEHDVQWWLQTSARIRSVAGKPLLADTQRWLVEHLVTENEWDLIRSAGQKLTLTPSQLVIRGPGSKPNRAFYLVTKGALWQVARVGSSTLKVHSLEPPRFSGHISMLTGGSESLTAYAAGNDTPSAVVSVPFERLNRILYADPHLAHRFFFLLCVTICEEYFAFRLQDVLEKHYMHTVGKTDPAPRDTLNVIFGQVAVKVSAKERLMSMRASSPSKIEHVEESQARESEERRVCEKLEIPRSFLVNSFPCTTSIRGLPGLLRGKLYLFRNHIGFLGKILGKTMATAIPLVTIEDCEVGKNNEITINHSELGKRLKHSYIFASSEPVATVVAHWENSTRHADSSAKLAASHNTSFSQLPDRTQGSGFEMSDQDWSAVFSCGNVRKLVQGEAVIDEGSVQQILYQLMEGTCHVVTEAEELVGKTTSKVIVHTLTAGQLFGEKNYLFGGSATASVVATGDVEVYAFDRNNFDKLFSTNPLLGAKFHSHLATYLAKRSVVRDERCLRNFRRAVTERRASDTSGNLDQLLSPRALLKPDPTYLSNKRKGSLGELSSANIDALM